MPRKSQNCQIGQSARPGAHLHELNLAMRRELSEDTLAYASQTATKPFFIPDNGTSNAKLIAGLSTFKYSAEREKSIKLMCAFEFSIIQLPYIA